VTETWACIGNLISGEFSVGVSGFWVEKEELFIRNGSSCFGTLLGPFQRSGSGWDDLIFMVI
jgi:hypothetical protein